MRTIFYIIQKEFIQIFRNKIMLPFIFVYPLVQLIILVNAATLEMKQIDMIVVDMDFSSLSRELTGKFKGSPFFVIESHTTSIKEAEAKLKSGEADIILHIPQNFEKDLFSTGEARLQLLTDAINATAAGITNAYCSYIIADFNKSVISENRNILPLSLPKTVEIEYSYWYNPELNYKTFMLPGILVILVSIIGMFLSSINIVREKEIGTIEQINVTPIKKYQFIIGKMVPFWLIAMFELGFGLIIGWVLYRVPVEGSLITLFSFTAVYLLALMGLGLFVSTISHRQQQVMFINFFFMLTFILMSGIFTPVESMPDWAVKVNIINPFAYFMRVIRMVMLKGSGFQEVAYEFYAMCIYAAVTLSLSVWRYRKTT